MRGFIVLLKGLFLVVAIPAGFFGVFALAMVLLEQFEWLKLLAVPMLAFWLWLALSSRPYGREPWGQGPD